MNKRILKLFNEAGFHQPEMERLGIEDKFEKFAELIVRECAELVDDHDPTGIIEGIVLQHFRVKVTKELDLILLRGPRTDDDGNRIPVMVSVVRKSETDLSNYSFLCKQEKLEEWVPTKELELYRMLLK